MTTRLLILLAAALLCWAAPASAQTIKSLGFNTTNGRIVASTNLVWTNAFTFSTNTVAAQVRTNLGLGGGDSVTFDALQVDSHDSATATNFSQLSLRATAVSFGGFYATYDGAYKFAFAAGGASNSVSDVMLFRVNLVEFVRPFQFSGTNATLNAATSRTNLGLPLPALTNDSNVTMMRALAGSTNTNQPFSGSIALTNTNTLVFSNGILLSQ